MGDVVDLNAFRQRNEAKTPEDKDLEKRLERIRESVNRINQLMQDLRGMQRDDN